MAFEWYRSSSTFDIEGSSVADDYEVVTPPLYCQIRDNGFFARDVFVVPGGISRWRFERRTVAAAFGVGFNEIRELRITRSAVPTRELWHERTGASYYNSSTGQYEDETLGDWELVDDMDEWTTQLTVTSEQNYGPPGTYELRFRRFIDDVEQGSPVIVGTFDLRHFSVVNIRSKCPFDPMEGPGVIAFDFACYPPPSNDGVFTSGWMPTQIDWELVVRDQYGFNVTPTGGSGQLTPSSPGADAIVASVEIVFDGIDSNGDFMTEDVRARVNALPTPKETFDENSGAITIFHRECSCNPSSNEATMGIPLGIAGLLLLYQSLYSCKPPSSLGYGWSTAGSAKITEPEAGVVLYRDESGMLKRWDDDGNGNYIPYRPDNYVELTKDLGSTTARYVLTFRNQTVREFNASGQIALERDRNNNETSYTFNGSSHLSSITDSKGRSVTFSYGGRTDGQPVEIRKENPVADRVVNIDYYSDTHDTAPNRVLRVTDASGLATEFEYDSRGRMSKRIQVRPTRGNLETVFGYQGASSRLAYQIFNGVLHTEYSHGFHLASGSFASGTSTFPVEDEEQSRTTHTGLDQLSRIYSHILNPQDSTPS